MFNMTTSLVTFEVIHISPPIWYLPTSFVGIISLLYNNVNTFKKMIVNTKL